MRSESKPLIIIVEDDDELAKLTSQYLELSGMHTQVYNRAAPALLFLKRHFANLLLLDLNLPDQSGFALAEELRENDLSIPIIFLTGNTLEKDKVKGLEMGGDDYITKPFSHPELVARIRAVLRRAEPKADFDLTKNARVSDQPFTFLGVKITPHRLEAAFPGGETRKLGRKEIGILA